jgi:hypothetical protein
MLEIRAMQGSRRRDRDIHAEDEAGVRRSGVRRRITSEAATPGVGTALRCEGAAAITPTADALIVLTNGGKLSNALGVHGFTAGLLVAAGLVLALG